MSELGHRHSSIGATAVAVRVQERAGRVAVDRTGFSRSVS
jgi:hypothetical protein